MSPEAREIGDYVASTILAKTEPRLERIEEKLEIVGPFFELKPGMDPLPVRMSHAEQVLVAHQDEQNAFEKRLTLIETELRRGNVQVAVAVIAAAGSILAAIVAAIALWAKVGPK